MILSVTVSPNAKTSTVVGWAETPAGRTLKIRLAAKPADGEANTELIRFLSELLHLPKSSITITHGHTSRTKRLTLPDLPLPAFPNL